MKETEQRIAIAEACGWKPEKTWNLGPNRMFGTSPEPPHLYKKLPDYPNDLSAMHEACGTTFGNSTAWPAFACELCQVVLGRGEEYSIGDQMVALCQATAAQHAEAFLRTLNLWKP